MNKRKALALVSAGLVAGLVFGSVGAAYAATGTAGTPLGAGARMGQAIRDAGARMIDIVADLTGLSVEDVQAQRAEGNSISDIAEANGVSSDAVVDEALAARKAILDAKVADGSITQEQADLAYEQMTERVTERVATDEVGRPSWAAGGTKGGRGGAGGQGVCDGSCIVTE
ncbi:MAG: hypothetical protein Q7W51_10330 [Coriobacteriia bacterium]|nr:hypothetical protein [Coriobacteriia bacterium]